jgi:hypothetical protein
MVSVTLAQLKTDLQEEILSHPSTNLCLMYIINLTENEENQKECLSRALII